jgi:hypothetical protein
VLGGLLEVCGGGAVEFRLDLAAETGGVDNRQKDGGGGEEASECFRACVLREVAEGEHLDEQRLHARVLVVRPALENADEPDESVPVGVAVGDPANWVLGVGRDPARRLLLGNLERPVILAERESCGAIPSISSIRRSIRSVSATSASTRPTRSRRRADCARSVSSRYDDSRSSATTR